MIQLERERERREENLAMFLQKLKINDDHGVGEKIIDARCVFHENEIAMTSLLDERSHQSRRTIARTKKRTTSCSYLESFVVGYFSPNVTSCSVIGYAYFSSRRL